MRGKPRRSTQFRSNQSLGFSCFLPSGLTNAANDRGVPGPRPYFLANFLTSPRKSAPYTLPSKSAVMPSARLEPPAYGYGHGSGMKDLTEPSRALPIRMPRWAPRL